MKLTARVAAAAVALGLFAQPVLADGPIGYQINPAHDGQTKFKKPFQGPLKQKWARNLGGEISTPFGADGMVFAVVHINSGAQLYALNPKTGATIWHKTVNSSYFANATYDNGRVFVLNANGLLQAYASDSVGTPQWAKQMPGSNDWDAPPTAYKGRVYLTSNSGVTAVDEATGSVVWTKGSGGSTSPAIGDGGLFLDMDCSHYRLSLKKGKLVWNDNTGCGGGGGANAAYFNGRDYTQDTGGGDMILDAKTGDLIGPYSAWFPPAFWTPASGNPVAFAVSDHDLNSFDTVTGNNGWSLQADDFFSVPPLVVNDTVVAGTSGGTLYAIDAATGTHVWSIELGSYIGMDWIGFTGMGVAPSVNAVLVPAGQTLYAFAPKGKR
ncbi:MAG TPA: PQQ-binding-like beta-propeller repeat protein [Rhizomicrobium sp.]|nr:PQQ-binding-like beta-propeller repeat protein [Rhizomicrobium sp.]